MRLTAVDAQFTEDAIVEQGYSPWGFPAFPTRPAAAHQMVQRKRRVVVGYRRLNAVTVRKLFLIPHGDSVKSSVAGCRYVSMENLREGSNQIENERGAVRKMAVVTPSGQWLPRGLTFGPTNGPEDFHKAMYTVFSRRRFKEWFLFIDDLAVATGQPRFVRSGPTGADDLLVVRSVLSWQCCEDRCF